MDRMRAQGCNGDILTIETQSPILRNVTGEAESDRSNILQNWKFPRCTCSRSLDIESPSTNVSTPLLRPAYSTPLLDISQCTRNQDRVLSCTQGEYCDIANFQSGTLFGTAYGSKTCRCSDVTPDRSVASVADLPCTTCITNHDGQAERSDCYEKWPTCKYVDETVLAHTSKKSCIPNGTFDRDSVFELCANYPRSLVYANSMQPVDQDRQSVNKIPRKKRRRRRQYLRRGQPIKVYRHKNAPDEVQDNFFLAMITTWLCFPPLGIISLYYTWKVKSALYNNKTYEARLYSLRGRKFANTGVKIGIACISLGILLLIVKDKVPYSSLEYDYYLPDYVGM